MAQKHRRSKPARPASPTVAPADARSERAAGRERGVAASGVAVLVATVLVACYVILFYAVHETRQHVLLLLFAPDDVIASWGGVEGTPLGFFDRLGVWLVAGLIVAVAWASGSIVVRAWRLDERLTRLETELFSIGLGLSAWSIWTLLVGLLGWLQQTWLVWLPAVIVAPVAGFQLAARRAEGTSPSALVPRPGRNDWIWPSMLALAIPFVLLYLLAGALPPKDFDVREYHLQVPKEWYQQGQITFLPHNVYGNMPLGAEMFALLGMTVMPGESGWWYGALAGKTVMAVCAVLTGLALFAAGRRIGSTTIGIVAALVYVSTPWVYLVSVSGRNEGVMAFYLVLAMYAVWLWWSEETAHASDAPSDEAAASFAPRGHWLELAGFLAGTTAAVKYTGVLFVVLPLLLLVTFARRRFAWKEGLIFLVGAVAASGLWYAKNAALTANPVYPLAYEVFDGATRTPEKAEQWNRAHQVPRDAQGRRYSLAQLGASAADVLLLSEWLSPLLIPLALLSVVAVRQRPMVVALAGLVVFYLLAWWLLTHRLERFWVPMLPLVAMLAGIGASWTAVRPWRHVLVAVLFWGLVANFLMMAAFGWRFDGAEEQPPEGRLFASLEYLRNDELFQPVVHRWLNANRPPEDYRVLLVGGAEPFNLQMPVYYNTCFDDVWFDRLFQGKSRDERLAALREHKIAYVLVDWSEIARYRSPGNYGFSDYITRELVHRELVGEQKLLRKVPIPELDPRRAELFEVIGVVPRPAE